MHRLALIVICFTIPLAGCAAPPRSPRPAEQEGHCPPTAQDLMANRYCTTPPSPTSGLNTYQKCMISAAYLGISSENVPTFCARYVGENR